MTAQASLVSGYTSQCQEKVLEANPSATTNSKRVSFSLADSASSNKSPVSKPHSKRTGTANLDPIYTNPDQDTSECQGETTNDSPDSQEESLHLPAMRSAYLTEAIKTAASQYNSTQPIWTQGKMTTAKLEAFAAAELPSDVQIQLNQPFGKGNMFQSFLSEKCFRHILLPVLKSGYMSRNSIKRLERASFRARQLGMLLKRYAHVDFRPLQGFQRDWEEVSTIREDWKAMTSACLLHFNGDVATVVRWVGGPHTAAQINPEETMEKLKDVIDPDIWTDLNRRSQRRKLSSLSCIWQPLVCPRQSSNLRTNDYQAKQTRSYADYGP